ncbi:PREDICTED: nucleolar protein 11-like [Branchiostoma belcheri]|uniref:Nucleolar protein 11-like n=1 Tax=Branchiostoma belcheri TaxID=7741 RepID=A0A6P4XRQ1_BRABE|nr:PREDICTED: nucleolar protein 11-like [Branchiostoma belcheri]
MATMSACFEVCSLPSSTRLLGVEPMCGGENIIVTTEKSVRVYRVRDQKLLHTWSIRQQGGQLTSPALYNPRTEEFIVLMNKQTICLWTKDLEHLSKCTKVTVKKPISHLKLLPDADPILVFDGGSPWWLPCITAAPDTAVLDVLDIEEELVWCDVTGRGEGVLAVCVSKEVKTDTQSYTAYLCELLPGNQDTPDYQTLQLTPPDNTSTLLCCCLEEHLLSVWSCGSVCSHSLDSSLAAVEDEGVVVPGNVLHKLDLPKGGDSGVSMVMLGPHHVGLAMEGKETVQIWDTKFWTLQADRSLQDVPGTGVEKLYRYGDYMIVARQTSVAALSFSIQPTSLAAVMGKQTAEAVTLVPQDWGGPAKKRRHLSTESSALLQKLLDPQQTRDLPSFEQVFSQLKTDRETLSSPAAVCQLTQRVVTEERFWARSTLAELVETGLLSGSSSPGLFERVEKENDVALWRSCLLHVKDIPEASLVARVQYLLGLDDSLLEPASADVPMETAEQDIPTCPLSAAKAALLDQVLCRSYSGLFLQDSLAELQFSQVMMFLRYLHYKLTSAPAPSQGNQGKVVSVDQVVDWLCALVDAHFTQLVLTPESRDVLLGLHEVVRQRLQFYQGLNDLDALLAQLKDKSPPLVTKKQDESLYSIRTIQIF